MRDVKSLKDALGYIPSDDYQTWITVVAALKNEVFEKNLDEETAYDLAAEFSATSPKFDTEVLYDKWKSFGNKPSILATPGTIYHLAEQYGYVKGSKGNIGAMAFGMAVSVSDDDNTVPQTDNSKLDTLQSRANHLITYLRAMYKQTDYIRILTEVDYNSAKHKWAPSGKGNYKYTVADIIKKINASVNADKPTLLGMELGQVSGSASYNHEAGGWIGINPLDGNGVDNSNVAQYKYALLESDELSRDEQLRYIRKLNLPFKAIIDSGNKSIHCILLINAKTVADYNYRVKFIYDFCEKSGFPVDRADKNPSRLYRLPGLIRGDSVQKFLELKNDASVQTFEEWQSGLLLGNPLEMADAVDNFDPAKDLAPELIHGILRHGHKLLLTASSKAGKTATLIELGLALATGSTWLGYQCEKSRVVYCNMEVAGGSFTNRVVGACTKLGLSSDSYRGYFYTFNLRGITLPLSQFVDLMIPRLKALKADAIIIDPIYKLMEGDENLSRDVGPLVGQFDRLAAATGASVIYSQHFAKGTAFANSQKAIVDRAAGSGVFGRDADAVVSMLQLDYEPLPDRPWLTAWRIQSQVREFAQPDDINVFLDFPIHTIDTDHILDNCKYVGDPSVKGGETRGEQLTAEKESKCEELAKTLRNYLLTPGGHCETIQIDDSGRSVPGVKTKLIQNMTKIPANTFGRYMKMLTGEFTTIKIGRVSYVYPVQNNTFHR